MLKATVTAAVVKLEAEEIFLCMCTKNYENTEKIYLIEELSPCCRKSRLPYQSMK